MEETSRVVVSAEQTNGNGNLRGHGSPVRIAGMMNVVIEVIHILRIDEPHHSRTVETVAETHEFSRPLAAFASAAAAGRAVEAILNSLPFHFPRCGTHWTNTAGDDADASSEPVDGIRGVAARVSELGARMKSQSESPESSLEMHVTVRKITSLRIAPEAHGNQEPWLRFHQNRDARVYSIFDYYISAVNAEVDRYLGRHQRAAPAPAPETVRCEGSNELVCSICIADVAIGSGVKLLPCSHMFHENCIAIWLNKHTTCPLCRSVVNLRC